MSTLCVDVSTTTLLLLARKNGRRITSADAATAVNIHRRHKEYATQRRLNVRLEEVRDHYVCEAGAQWTVFCLPLDESDSAISDSVLLRTKWTKVSICTACFKHKTVDGYYLLLCALKTTKDFFFLHSLWLLQCLTGLWTRNVHLEVLFELPEKLIWCDLRGILFLHILSVVWFVHVLPDSNLRLFSE